MRSKRRLHGFAAVTCLSTLLVASLVDHASGAPHLTDRETLVPFACGPVTADPTRNVAYLVDATNSRLLAINTDSGKEVAEAPIDDGTTYGNMTVSLDGKELYLVETEESELMVFSLPGLSHLRTLTFADGVFNVASGVDGRLFISTDSITDPSSLLEVDPKDGTVLDEASYQYSTIEGILRLNADGTHLYVTNTGDDFELFCFDLARGLQKTPAQYFVQFDYLTDFLPDEKEGRYYVADSYIKGLAILNMSTLGTFDNPAHYSGTWPMQIADPNIVSVAFAPSGSVVFAAAVQARFDPALGIAELREFDRTTGTPLADWLFNDGFFFYYSGMAATPNGSLLYLRYAGQDSFSPPTSLSKIGLLSALGQPVKLKPTLTVTISFPPIASAMVGDTIPLNVTDSENLPITYTVSGPARIVPDPNSGYDLDVTGVGTVTVTASITGSNGGYTPVSAQQVFQVDGTEQSIAPFVIIPNHTFGDPPFAVVPPTSSSGLPVTVTVQSGPAKFVKGLLTLTGGGAVTLAANQPGNTTTNPAPVVTTSFVVEPASQSIAAFKPIRATTVGAAPFAIAAPVATSKLPVTLSILSGQATLANNVLTATGVGTVTVAADQAGNSNYAAAPEVTTSFQVGKGSQTIAKFGRIPGSLTVGETISLMPPSATSSLPVILSVKSGPATISGNEVTLNGVGVVVIAADQPGDANYEAAPEVTTTFRVR
jgi:hypothetical protein